MTAPVLAELSYWQQSILRSIGVLVAVLLPAGTFVYLFLFKAISFMQSRLGPNEAGPYGSMQLLGAWTIVTPCLRADSSTAFIRGASSTARRTALRQ